MKTKEQIFSENLNYNRVAMSGYECSDEEYTTKWIKWYPDTYENIMNAMEEYKNQDND